MLTTTTTVASPQPKRNPISMPPFLWSISTPHYSNPHPSPPTPPALSLSASLIQARTHNTLSPLLSSLPTEILLIITANADPPTIMALRGTCSRLATLFPSPTSQLSALSRTETWRKEYSRRRRWFQLACLRYQERRGQLDAGQLVCTPCIATHDVTCFSAGMQGVEPGGTRKCLGWARRLRLCEHKSVGLEALRFFNPDVWCGQEHGGVKSRYSQLLTPFTIFQRPDPIRFEYLKKNVQAGGRGVRTGIVGRQVDGEGRPLAIEETEMEVGGWGADVSENILEEIGRLEGAERWREELRTMWREVERAGSRGLQERKIVLRAEVVLLKVDREAKIACEQILEALRGVRDGTDGNGLVMCPHLTLSMIDALVRKLPYVDCARVGMHTEITKPCTEPETLGAWFGNLLFGYGQPHHCGQKYRCPIPRCDTSFYFYRARYVQFAQGGMDELVLCIVRQLGTCRDPFDEGWLAQLEQLE
ncbi:hypothetical protein EJ04DRAFT_580820 [Polyplosphaeria fusca]|uniref:F-box domain-containing protein n=1 Tax=Polyplosphaeria fusca TaxID=682080 RepID=A0A9P4UYG3_9PLEO|nr:hypothetical protein EJ04DRAFT_580820 [Polyplosphaeria fusca]